eukprot:3750396-Pyramimonas_sp.AAC.1
MMTSQKRIARCLTRTFQWEIESRLLAAHINKPPSAAPAGQRKGVGSHGGDGGGRGSRGVPPFRAISLSAVLRERRAPSRGAAEQPSRRRTAKPSAG